jgi:hypothetical protein
MLTNFVSSRILPTIYTVSPTCRVIGKNLPVCYKTVLGLVFNRLTNIGMEQSFLCAE